jgi:hypothetical protein
MALSIMVFKKGIKKRVKTVHIPRIFLVGIALRLMFLDYGAGVE